MDVIQYQDPTGQIIVARVPSDGTAAIKLGSQLIVEESQQAVFFRDGKALDTFGPGRHTLATENVPIPWISIRPGCLPTPLVGRVTIVRSRPHLETTEPYSTSWASLDSSGRPGSVTSRRSVSSPRRYSMVANWLRVLANATLLKRDADATLLERADGAMESGCAADEMVSERAGGEMVAL